jgi:uncharacterized heparinase superfamily protein
MDVGRLLRTVRYLKPVQVYGRLGERLPKPAPKLGPAPPTRALARSCTAWAPREPSLIGPTRARFLGEEAEFAGAGAWNDPVRARLWLYNLHYFDDLTAGGGPESQIWRQAMLARWIAENPPGAGTGWEPYPTALRIVNWIKWALAGQPMATEWLHSLAIQTRWLADRLEWRLLGNHLMADIKALIFAGLYFEGPEAEAWLAKGLQLHQRQLAEQVLADGGHFERSPMYQAIMLEDLLDLINLGGAAGGMSAATLDRWGLIADRMGGWLNAMTHPDGAIGFFNDAAFGIAAEPEALEAYAGRLGREPAPAPGTTWLDPSGYVRLAMDEAVALIDIAPIGPDYLPGHAHADTLSFELSLGLERVIVNGGTSTYAEGDQRSLERATASHSTVEVDGGDSSEVWAGFRVGRRARVRNVLLREDGGAVQVSAAHDGYAHRPGRPIHRRAWRMTGSRLTLTDLIEGRCGQAVARFHLGPGVTASPDADNRSGDLTTSAGRVVRWTSSQPARIEPSEWRPRFGVRQQIVQLAIPLTSAPLVTEFTW